MRLFKKRNYALVVLCSLISAACDPTSGSVEALKLTLIDQNYTSVPVGLVGQCIEALDLSYNNLSYIAEYSFQPSTNLTNLRDLRLSNNVIFKISVRAFRNLQNLMYVDLSDNILTFLHPYTFYHNTNLMRLDLQDNPLHSLEVESPILVSGSLLALDIRFSGLMYLNIINFDDLPNMRHLFLSYDAPQMPFISNVTSYSIFEVTQNKRKFDLEVIMKSESSKVTHSVKYWKHRANSQQKIEHSDILISKDMTNLDQKLVKICHEDYESNEVKFICIQKNLTTIPEFNTTVESLDLNGNNIMQLFEDSFEPSSSLKKINLSNNNLTKLSVRTFRRLPLLTDLDLSRNYLEYIHPHTFYHNKHLEKLGLQENNLHSIEMESPLLVSQSLFVLDLRYCDFTDFSIRNFDYLYSLRTIYLSSNTSQKPYINNITDFYTLVVRGNHKRMKCDLEVISEYGISGTKVTTECWNYKVNVQLTTVQGPTAAQDQEKDMSTEIIQTTAKDQEEINSSENFSEEMVTQQPTEIMTTTEEPKDNVHKPSEMDNILLICIIISSISLVCVTCLVILHLRNIINIWNWFPCLYRITFEREQNIGNNDAHEELLGQ